MALKGRDLVANVVIIEIGPIKASQTKCVAFTSWNLINLRKN